MNQPNPVFPSTTLAQLRACLADLEAQLNHYRQIAESLAELEEENSAFLQANPDLLLLIRDDTIVDCRIPAVPTFATPQPAQLLGQRLQVWLPGEVALRMQQAIDRVIDRQRASEVVEYRLQAEEPPREYEARIVPAGTQRVLILVRDVTQDRQAAALRTALQEQVITVLRERERLARELHDNLGQVLGYASTQAQATAAALAQGQAAIAQSYLHELLTVLQETQADMHGFILGAKVSTGLNPQEPGVIQSFVATLQDYREQFTRLYGLPIRWHIAPDQVPQIETALTLGAKVQLFRVIQEALTNVRKHAAAHTVRMTCTIQDNQILVVVEDDGCGFDMTQLPADESGVHYGLVSMRDRVAELRGSLQIDSALGRGTTVRISLPLDMPEQQAARKVLVVDDHPLFAQGIKNLLLTRGFTIVGIAHNGLEAIEYAQMFNPALIIMDIEMPECNGLEATRLIKAAHPDIQIVMLTMSADEAHLLEAIKYGASGYLLKNLDADQFFTLLDDAMRGEVVLSPGLASRVLEECVPQENPAGATARPQEPSNLTLSDRQLEVLRLVAQGYTYKEIGRQLHLSEATIKYHMGEIVQRLHVNSRAEAIAYAAQKGWSLAES